MRSDDDERHTAQRVSPPRRRTSGCTACRFAAGVDVWPRRRKPRGACAHPLHACGPLHGDRLVRSGRQHVVVLAVLPLLGFATFVQTAVMTGAPQMPTVFGGLQKVSGVYKVAVQRCCRLAVPILVLVPLKCHLHTQTHTHTPVSVRRLCRRVCDASSVTHLAVTAGQSGISDDAFGHAGDTANEAVQALRTVHSYNLQSRVAASYAALVAVPVRRMCRAGLAAGFVFGLSQCILFLFFALAFWCGSRARRSVAELLGSRSTS